MCTVCGPWLETLFIRKTKLKKSYCSEFLKYIYSDESECFRNIYRGEGCFIRHLPLFCIGSNILHEEFFFFTKFAFPQIEKFIQRINNKVTMSSWINQYARISFYQYTPWPFIINAIAMHKYKTVKYNKNTYSYRTCASRMNRIQQFIYCVWFWIRADLFWLEVISVCPKAYHQLLSKRSA